jgi:hypothetical protein
VIRYLKNLILNKIIRVPLATEKKEMKKYVISEKNPWLNTKDNFGKLERGKFE